MTFFTSRARHTDMATATTKARDTAGARDEAARDEDLVGVGVVGEPPPEEGGRLIDRPAEQSEPGMAELRLEGELPGCPFRRAPT